MDEADYRYIDVNTEQNHAYTYLYILHACTMQNQAFDHNLQSTYSKEIAYFNVVCLYKYPPNHQLVVERGPALQRNFLL